MYSVCIWTKYESFKESNDGDDEATGKDSNSEKDKVVLKGVTIGYIMFVLWPNILYFRPLITKKIHKNVDKFVLI